MCCGGYYPTTNLSQTSSVHSISGRWRNRGKILDGTKLDVTSCRTRTMEGIDCQALQRSTRSAGDCQEDTTSNMWGHSVDTMHRRV